MKISCNMLGQVKNGHLITPMERDKKPDGAGFMKELRGESVREMKRNVVGAAPTSACCWSDCESRLWVEFSSRLVQAAEKFMKMV